MVSRKELESVISEILKLELEMLKYYSDNPNEKPNTSDQWQVTRGRLKELRKKYNIV